jgi:hypothetical protein
MVLFRSQVDRVTSLAGVRGRIARGRSRCAVLTRISALRGTAEATAMAFGQGAEHIRLESGNQWDA